MPDGKLSMGEPVWAKLKGFSPWPGKIAQAPEGLRQPAKKRAHCVYFFGTENYAFIEPQFIKPFAQHRDKLARINKSNQFKEALAVIDDYLLQQRNGTPVQSGDGPTTTVTKKEKAKKPAKEDSSPKKRGPKPAGEKKPKKVADPGAKKEKKALTNGTSPKKTVQSANKISTDADKPKKKRKPAASAKRPAAAVADQSFSPEISPPPKKVRQQSPAYDGDVDRVPAVGASASRRLPDSDDDAFSSLLNHSASTKRVASLLNRPTLVTRPETPPLDVGQVSSTLKEKNIRPSELRFGLLGLGVMGSGIGKNLLNSGHQLHVWNRSSEKCDHYVKAGAEHGLTPSDVVGAADVTFCCVSDPQVTKDIIYGNCGVLQEINTTKGYVEMTGIDSETSQDVADAIGAKGGRYLEAQMQGSRQQAEEGTLVILCSGDRSLFDDCQSCFQAMGKNSFYLGEVGNASKMNLVLQLVYGVQMAALAEGMALADRAGLRQKDVLEVLSLTDQACPLLLEKGRAIIEGGFSTQMALKHMQKDLRLCMSLSDQLEQPLPLTSTANEIFKHAKRVGYGDHDVAAVYLRARF